MKALADSLTPAQREELAAHLEQMRLELVRLVDNIAPPKKCTCGMDREGITHTHDICYTPQGDYVAWDMSVQRFACHNCHWTGSQEPICPICHQPATLLRKPELVR